MIIELYTDQYADDLRRMIGEFHQESLDDYGLSLDRKTLDQTIDALKHQTYLMILDGKAQGVLAGKEVETPSGVENVWHEVVWYVSKNCRRYGIKMLKIIIEKVRDQGYKHMVMCHMHNGKTEKLARLYERLGFKPMETHYMGRL